MSGRHRMVLGRYADAADGAARRSAAFWGCGAVRSGDYERMAAAAVERVRRHFGRRSKTMGDKYSRVARAYFHHRNWKELGIPRRSFSHALKKVKDFLYACKQRTKSTPGA